MNVKGERSGPWGSLKKALLILAGILAVFGVLGSGFLIVRDTGKMPPRPDRELDKVFDSMAIEGRLCVTVSRFENTIYELYQPGEEIDARTEFTVGSLADQFVALAVLLLEERKELDVEKNLASYLTDLPAWMNKVTIHHLLTHTSGLGPGQGLEDLAGDPLDIEPGAQSIHAPLNYQLLKRLIQETTGESAPSFIRENLLAPLGLEHTYFEEGETGRGWVSCMEDLRKWESSLNSNRLVRLKTLLRFFQPPRLEDGTRGAYGCGWRIESVRGLRMEYSAAEEPGVHAAIARFSERNFALFLLIDTPNELDTYALALTIAEVYLGREMPMPPSP